MLCVFTVSYLTRAIYSLGIGHYYKFSTYFIRQLLSLIIPLLWVVPPIVSVLILHKKKVSTTTFEELNETFTEPLMSPRKSKVERYGTMASTVSSRNSTVNCDVTRDTCKGSFVGSEEDSDGHSDDLGNDHNLNHSHLEETE